MVNLGWTIVPLLSFAMQASAQASADCGAPPSSDFSTIDKRSLKPKYGNGFKVHYVCAPDYDRIGKTYILCKNGQWTPLTMICEKKTCGNAGDLPNGHFKYEGSAAVGDRAFAECNEGYTVKGMQYIICKATGWSESRPSCERGTARMEGTCKTPRELKHGVTNGLKSVYRPGDQLFFSCNDRYSLTGSNMVACSLEGTWTPVFPTCTFTKCPPLNVPNGKLSSGHLRAASVITISCLEGYQLRGPDKVTCSMSGKWMEEIPTCVLEGGITCPAPSVTNGVKTSGDVSEYRVRDTVTFTCSESFLLTGSPQVTCGPDGQWLPRLPECTPPGGDCGVPPYLANAHLADSHRSQTSFPSGSRVRYVCALGYVREGGSPFRTCNQGSWLRLGLQCERKSCGSAGQVNNGQFIYTGSDFGDSATAECYEGYQLVGQGTRNCMNGGWDGRVPVCEVVQCDEPREVVNGERIGAPEPPYVYSSVIRYRCRVGKLIGERDIYCTKDGQWSAPAPECRESEITCPAPSVTNGVKTSGDVSEYRVRDTVTFTCSESFLLTGSPQVTCGPDGQWLPRLPECTPPGGDCGVPPYLANAHLADSHRSQTSFPSGSRVRYVCALGYVRERGSSFRTCNQGSWLPLQMTCERKSCGSAGQINNGQFIYTGSDFGDSAIARCNEGYQLVGQGTRNCMNGGWDGRVPVCEVVQCDEPREVVNGERIGAPEPPYVYSSVIRYRCRVGKLIGERDIYCTKDGQWSAPAPECRDVTCPYPNVHYAQMSGTPTLPHVFGDSVTFYCHWQLRIYGASTVTCGPDGNWTPALPTCRY